MTTLPTIWADAENAASDAITCTLAELVTVVAMSKGINTGETVDTTIGTVDGPAIYKEQGERIFPPDKSDRLRNKRATGEPCLHWEERNFRFPILRGYRVFVHRTCEWFRVDEISPQGFGGFRARLTSLPEPA